MSLRLLISAVLALLAPACSSLERSLLYHPTHAPPQPPLKPWVVDSQPIGFSHTVADPKTVWLLLHGNGGQASDRSYTLDHFSPADSVYILEYPGYGQRPGKPSRTTIDRAANSAYAHLRQTFPDKPVCVASESIGSGPACTLASLPIPPEKLVLVVPFDQLAAVAKNHLRPSIVSIALRSNWDNIAAIQQFPGQIDIFAATGDTLIPAHHARNLANSHPRTTFTLIDGGHNDWSLDPRVQFHYP